MSKVKPFLVFLRCGLPYKFKIQRAECRSKGVMAALRPFHNFDFLFLTFALLLAGCAEQQRYEAVEPICVPDMDMAEAMQMAEEVLARMHFVIEKADSEHGVIRTRPLPAAQFFEFWRSDNVGALATAEANLHSIRRIVELHIGQQDGTGTPLCGNQVSIDCDAQVQRLSLPEFKIPASGGLAWVDLGKDTMLETEILKRIEQQITSDESPATSDEK